MGIAHGGPNFSMAQDRANFVNAHAMLYELGGMGMAKRVDRAVVQARSIERLSKRDDIVATRFTALRSEDMLRIAGQLATLNDLHCATTEEQ